VLAGVVAVTVAAVLPAAAPASAAADAACTPGVRSAVGAVTSPGPGCAGRPAGLMRISSDPYTDPSGQHATEDDSGTASFGSTVVSAFQQSLFGDAGAGGAIAIGFATSHDRGQTWVHGSLPGVGPGSRFSGAIFPAVAYDRRARTWLITFVGAVANPTDPTAPPEKSDVLVSRSTDGGRNWSQPVTIAEAFFPTDFADTSITCDTGTSSRFYGNCYATFWMHNNAGGNKVIRISTSTNGGRTWTAARGSADDAPGIRSVPLVRPDGTVVVVMTNWIAGEPSTQVRAFESVDGGSTWSASRLVAPIMATGDPGATLIGTTLVSASVDGAGRLYAVWQDCRFRPGCQTNDIVMSTSSNGTTWSPVRRITTATGDHAYPGIGADPQSAGPSARLGITYYTYPDPLCTLDTCTLDTVFISSPDGGATWSKPIRIAGPMRASWLASGPGPGGGPGWIVTNYLTTTVLPGGNAITAFPFATAPTGNTLHQDMYAIRGGTPIRGR
jgi:hypothetical protein